MSLAVHAHDLSVSFGERMVLENISVHIPEKTFTIIFGPNGAGKSTFLKVLTGEIEPTKGSIEVCGTSPVKARKEVGFVPQEILIRRDFPMTVFDAVLMGRYARCGFFKRPSQADRAIVQSVLETVELADKRDRQLRELSGGQLQRVFVARALVSEPKLLLLDEAISGVDVGVKESLYQLLIRLKQNLAVVFVTHDVSVVSREVDAIMCLNRTLVSHGTPQDALTEEAIRCMYGDDMALFSHCHAPHVHVPKGGGCSCD